MEAISNFLQSDVKVRTVIIIVIIMLVIFALAMWGGIVTVKLRKENYYDAGNYTSGADLRQQSIFTGTDQGPSPFDVKQFKRFQPDWTNA